ncbi:MAG TPA: T9SS type A sorting domain-containing protein [Prolixibacteraceae bacterium]|nr:T9SS type A sorting domain-containing protein [Prolixibacteraceae bacterium]
MGTPEELSIEDETFDGTSTECFGATQTITVAENGNEVLFENGSITNLIAGHSIRFLPGTNIQPGAYVHAWITINNSFCDALPEAIVAANNITEKSSEFADISVSEQFEDATLKVFPNPSDGLFTIQTTGFGENSNINIYNSVGKKVFSTQLCKAKTLELYNLPKGIYILKTTNKTISRIQRIVIH